jgi:pyruvate,water dikinase
VESVHGLNQGLVDGTVEPDRWVVDRATGRVAAHTSAQRDRFVACGAAGVQLAVLPAALSGRPPLDGEEVHRVFQVAMEAEGLFGRPQDVEWTFRNGTLWVLQSRPITTAPGAQPEDKRAWYLTLRRSFDNLKALGEKIEKELIPAMIGEAARLAAVDLRQLGAEELAQAVKERAASVEHWTGVYWRDFIPFAHGVRLFGQVYNDAVRPADPYEFMDLLAATGMESIARNRMLEDLAAWLRRDAGLQERLRNGADPGSDTGFERLLGDFMARFGDLSCTVGEGSQCHQGPEAILRVVLEMAAHVPALARRFLERFQGDERTRAAELFDLARKSHQLRDDDNIHLGRIETHWQAAVDEAQRRLEERSLGGGDAGENELLRRALASWGARPGKAAPQSPAEGVFALRPRQLVGQPAGPGLGRGRARVLVNSADVNRFAYGEVLVCDAIDPNMTFLVPLAAALVERRGGMLIHGAIIAREYGLPCVTGVPDATSLIRTGDVVTVDGYLGIVTVTAGRTDPAA